MKKPEGSPKPYNVIAALIFLIGVGLFAYMGVFNWLPALFVSVGFAVMIRQLLMGYHLDAAVAFVVFGACFFASFLTFFARVFLPTFLMLGTLYYIFRQFVSVKDKLVVKTTDVHLEKEGTDHE